MLEFKVLHPRNDQDSWSEDTFSYHGTLNEALASIKQHTDFLPEPFKSEEISKSTIYSREVGKWSAVQ